MEPILLINPNSSTATTELMVEFARETAGATVQIRGETVASGPPMITTEEALDAAEAGVIDIGLRQAGVSSGVIVAAFGDPGAAELKRRLAIPAVGICEASMIEAAALERRFAVVTTTLDLVRRIGEHAAQLGYGHQYAGTWITDGEAADLVSGPQRLERALRNAVAACVREANVGVIIIGGGPLSRAATAIADGFALPVIVPVAAAVRHIVRGFNPAR